MKPEGDDGDWSNSFSPETCALLKGLGDTPDSLALKAEYLKSINTLRRGLLAFDTELSYLDGIIFQDIFPLEFHEIKFIEGNSCHVFNMRLAVLP